MSRPITEYEKEAIGRVEEFRVRENLTQESMAELMGLSISQYKRFVEYDARISLEAIHNIALAYPADLKYLVMGKHQAKYNLINTMVSDSYEEQAKVYDELASYYRDKQKLALQEEERRREKARNKKSRTDYLSDDGDLIETNKED